MSDQAFFDEASGTVRFWVPMGEVLVGAMVKKETLHYRYHPLQADDEPLKTYRENLQEINEAVRSRLVNGSIEPVMLRDADLAARAA